MPGICANLGIITPAVAVPMQLATSIGRCASPVAGAVLAVAGASGVDISVIFKRIIVPVIFSFVVCVISSYVFTIILG